MRACDCAIGAHVRACDCAIGAHVRACDCAIGAHVRACDCAIGAHVRACDCAIGAHVRHYSIHSSHYRRFITAREVSMSPKARCGLDWNERFIICNFNLKPDSSTGWNVGSQLVLGFRVACDPKL